LAQQDEDGSWRLLGRLDGDHGAVLDAALAEARDRLFRDGQRDVTWVDALVDIAELRGIPAGGGELWQLVACVDGIDASRARSVYRGACSLGGGVNAAGGDPPRAPLRR
jgi:hypothetical protein